VKQSSEPTSQQRRFALLVVAVAGTIAVGLISFLSSVYILLTCINGPESRAICRTADVLDAKFPVLAVWLALAFGPPLLAAFTGFLSLRSERLLPLGVVLPAMGLAGLVLPWVVWPAWTY
jgi:hypothetical protein